MLPRFGDMPQGVTADGLAQWHNIFTSFRLEGSLLQ